MDSWKSSTHFEFWPVDSENKRDATLLRMLKTPPQKHTAKSRAKRDADEISRELDKGKDADLDKVARKVGNE